MQSEKFDVVVSCATNCCLTKINQSSFNLGLTSKSTFKDFFFTIMKNQGSASLLGIRKLIPLMLLRQFSILH